MKWVWRVFFSFLSLFIESGVMAKDFHDFDTYQKKLDRSYVEHKIKKYLQKDSEIENYFAVTEKGFFLYSSHLKKTRNEPEYLLAFREEGEKLRKEKKKGLAGARIAIDPGHFGGEYAELEERFIDMKVYENGKTSLPVRFNEGTLTLLTALALKDMLEKEGAVVFLTKDQIGKGVYKEAFFTWMQSHREFWNTSMTIPQIFRTFYNPLDLQARAEKINQFEPDATIIIHYNADDTRDPVSQRTGPSNENYNMVFIPGAFSKTELAKEENRYEFLRLLVTTDEENSERLSALILKEFVQVLDVPAVTQYDAAPYLHRVCLKLTEGVYARNLCLTRMVHGPLCYGETLLQNNNKESQRLAKNDTEIRGIACPSRVVEVAEGYFFGLKKYFETQ